MLSGRGVAIVRDVAASLRAGVSATAPLVDGALVALAGVLLFVPGFASDAVALALLVPPVRAAARDRLIRKVGAHLRSHGVVTGGAVAADGVIDVDATEVKAAPTPRPGLPDAFN